MREGEIRGAPPHLGAWQHHGHPPPRGGDWVGGHPEEDPGGRSPGGKQNLIGSPTPLPTRWSPAPLEGHVRKTTSLKIIGGPAPPPIRWSPAPHTRGTRPDHLLINLSCLFFFPLLARVIVLILFLVLFRFLVHLSLVFFPLSSYSRRSPSEIVSARLFVPFSSSCSSFYFSIIVPRFFSTRLVSNFFVPPLFPHSLCQHLLHECPIPLFPSLFLSLTHAFPFSLTSLRLSIATSNSTPSLACRQCSVASWVNRSTVTPMAPPSVGGLLRLPMLPSTSSTIPLPSHLNRNLSTHLQLLLLPLLLLLAPLLLSRRTPCNPDTPKLR